jgi:hypothetical protein
MHVPPARATTGQVQAVLSAFLFDTRAGVVNIGVQEKEKRLRAWGAWDLVN